MPKHSFPVALNLPSNFSHPRSCSHIETTTKFTTSTIISHADHRRGRPAGAPAPVQEQEGSPLRWIVRSPVYVYILYRILRRMWEGRASPRSGVLGTFDLATMFASLLLSSIVELMRDDCGIKEYNQLLLWAIEIVFATVSLLRQILNATATTPGPFLVKFTSLWKVLCSIVELRLSRVGQRFGFMDMSVDVNTLINRAESWKLIAILCGTISRLHPWLTAILKPLMLVDATRTEYALFLSHITDPNASPSLR